MRLLTTSVLTTTVGLLGLWGLAQAQSLTESLAQSPAVPQARSGSPVQQCVNIGNALEAPVEGEWGHVITQTDMDRIAQLGFDTVRLPIAWSEHLDSRGRIDPRFLARVDEVVGWAEARGLNVMIDVHHFTELEDNADAHIPTLIGIWDQLAVHYRNASERVIFEIVNEPSGDFTIPKVNRVNREILSRIRQTNPDRWVVLGSGHWGTITPFVEGADPAFAPVSDPRTIATFHSYAPYEFTHQGVTWAEDPPPLGRTFGSRADLREINSDFDEAARFSQRSGMPVLLGEFGAYIETISPADRVRYVRTMREAADARNLGWCHYDWAGSFRMYDADSDTLLPGFPEALGLR